MRVVYILFLSIIYTNATTLDIDNLISKAIATHPDMRSIMQKQNIDKSEISIAKSANMPTADINLEYNPTKTFTSQASGFSTFANDSKHIDLSLNYVLYDFEQTKNKIEIINNKAKITSLLIQDSKNLLVYKIKKFYDLLVLEKKNIDIAEADVKLKLEVLNQAKAFLDSGIKTKIDKDAIEANVFEAKDSLELARARFEKAKISMQYLIGEKLGDEIELQDTLTNNSLIKISQNNISTLLTNLPQNNISLKIAELSISNDDENLKFQQNRKYPLINLFAFYSKEDNIYNYDTKVVGLKSSISIFDGDKKNLEIQKATIEKSKSLSDYESKKISLEENILNLIIDTNRYISTIESKNNIIAVTKSARELTNARYKEGLATYIEILEAIKNENLAQKALLQAVFERNDLLHTMSYLTNKKENKSTK